MIKIVILIFFFKYLLEYQKLIRLVNDLKLQLFSISILLVISLIEQLRFVQSEFTAYALLYFYLINSNLAEINGCLVIMMFLKMSIY